MTLQLWQTVLNLKLCLVTMWAVYLIFSVVSSCVGSDPYIEMIFWQNYCHNEEFVIFLLLMLKNNVYVCTCIIDIEAYGLWHVPCLFHDLFFSSSIVYFGITGYLFCVTLCVVVGFSNFEQCQSVFRHSNAITIAHCLADGAFRLFNAFLLMSLQFSNLYLIYLFQLPTCI